MPLPFALRARRGAVASALLALALLPLALPGGAAQAYACRADPVVTLSNGVTVDLHVSINDTLNDVVHISYVLHGPPVLSAVAAYPDGTGAISSFRYVPDNNVGNYDADIVVTTRTSVSMTGYLDWVIGLGQPTPTAPAQGHSGQDLHIHMHVA
jgi:hypothetical protein